jgi:hypothetical protein
VSTQESPRPTFLTTLATVKLLGIPLASIIDAVPEALLVAAFVRGLVWPVAMGAGYVQWLFLVFLIEFLVVHSSAMVGSLLVSSAPRWGRIAALLGLSTFYFIFAGAMAFGFQSWIPVVTLAGLTLNRLGFILLRDTRRMSRLTKADMVTEWAFGGTAYILSYCAGAGLLSQFSHYLWNAAVREQYFVLHGKMSGEMDLPIAAGVLYFTARAVRALFFSRELGVARYERNDAPLRRDRVLGIHVGLWYLLWRQLGLYLLQTAALVFLSILFSFLGMHFVAYVGAAMWVMATYLFLAACVRFQRVSVLLEGPAQPVSVQALDDEHGSRMVTRIAVPMNPEPSTDELRLAVEPVRRRNFLPPGTFAVPGELFASLEPGWPTVVRIGRTYLCTSNRNIAGDS